jgi:nucleoside-diphosphate-sugar epimerase
MSLTAVVTGAGGFIGRRLATGLARRGWDVIALTSSSAVWFGDAGVRPVKCVWNERGVREAASEIGNADLWVHAAACVQLAPAAVATPMYRANALLAEIIARAARRSGARLAYLSTVSVYGPGQRLSVDVEPAPATDYGLSKLLGERLCLATLEERCWVLRLPGVWGKEKHPRLFINACLEAAADGRGLIMDGPGTGRRNYLWVGDVVALIEAGFQENWRGLHLAAGPAPLSIYEMVTAIGARYGVSTTVGTPTAPEKDVLVDIREKAQTTPFDRALEEEAACKI